MDLWRQEIEDAQDALRLSAPFCARLTGPTWTMERGPRGSITSDIELGGDPTRRGYAFARSERSEARRQSARAMGLLQIWGPGKGRSPDSGGETARPGFWRTA